MERAGQHKCPPHVRPGVGLRQVLKQAEDWGPRFEVPHLPQEGAGAPFFFFFLLAGPDVGKKERGT